MITLDCFLEGKQAKIRAERKQERDLESRKKEQVAAQQKFKSARSPEIKKQEMPPTAIEKQRAAGKKMQADKKKPTETGNPIIG